MDYRRADTVRMTREIPRIIGKTYPSDYTPPQTRARRRSMAASCDKDEEDGGGDEAAAQTRGKMKEDPCAICEKALPEAGRGTTSCGHVFCFECVMEFLVHHEKCLTCKAVVEAVVMTEREDNQFLRQCQPPRPVATFPMIGSGSKEEQLSEFVARGREIRTSFVPSGYNDYSPHIYRLVPEEWNPNGVHDSAGKGKSSGKQRAKLISVKVELSDDEGEHYTHSTVAVGSHAAADGEGRKRRAADQKEDRAVRPRVLGGADSVSSIVKVEPTEGQVQDFEVQIPAPLPAPATPAPVAPAAPTAPATLATPEAPTTPDASGAMSAGAAPVIAAAAATPLAPAAAPFPAPSAGASRVMSVAGARAREQHQARERDQRLEGFEVPNDVGEDAERQRRRERKVERRGDGGQASAAVAEPRRSEAERASPAVSSAVPTTAEASAVPAVARGMDGGGVDNGGESESNGEGDAVRAGGQFAGSPSSPPSRGRGRGPVIGWQGRVVGWQSMRRR